MSFTIIDYGEQTDCPDCSDLPSVYEYNPGAVIKCDRCGQKWWHSKFHVWEKTNWSPKNDHH